MFKRRQWIESESKLLKTWFYLVCLPYFLMSLFFTSSASIKFLWLRQIHDPSSISPAFVKALSTALSCCSQHFFPVRILASFMHLHRVVTLSDNDSKQIAVATSFRMSALLTLSFFSGGQKNLVNSENKENLSNYQLLKRKKFRL